MSIWFRRLRLSVTTLVAVALVQSLPGAATLHGAGLPFALATVEAGYGAGIDNTWLARAGLQWQWSQLSSRSEWLDFQTCWQLSAGLWRGDRDIVDCSLTPILRFGLARPVTGAVFPYLEGAVGFHYISDIAMRNRVFSTNFQFGDHLGVGCQFGKQRAVDLCYQFQHLSNASIKRPNAGINFHIVRIGVRF